MIAPERRWSAVARFVLWLWLIFEAPRDLDCHNY